MVVVAVVADGAVVAAGRLDDLLARATARGVFGTKMRSFISTADPAGIAAFVEREIAPHVNAWDEAESFPNRSLSALRSSSEAGRRRAAWLGSIWTATIYPMPR